MVAQKMNDLYMDYSSIIDNFKGRGVTLKPEPFHISIPNAKAYLCGGLKEFIGSNYIWLPEYDDIVDWMADNKGLGLFCMGNCGRGKTTICSQILPCIINQIYHKNLSLYLAREMNRDYQKVMCSHLIVIDDIGREEPFQEFGNHFNAFPDIVDDCERKGKFLIASTNCAKEELAAKYGERTISRLKATTRLVAFSGIDFRGIKNG